MASTDDFYSFMSGNVAPEQPDSDVAATENNPEVAAQSAAIDRLQQAKDITKRHIDQMGQISSETPGGILAGSGHMAIKSILTSSWQMPSPLLTAHRMMTRFIRLFAILPMLTTKARLVLVGAVCSPVE